MSVSFSLFFASIIAGSKGKKQFVHVPGSQVTWKLCQKFYEAGYISSFSLTDTKELPFIRVRLRYLPTGESILSGLKVLTRSSQRNYISYAGVRKLIRTKRLDFLLSTTKGLIWSSQARNYRLGGELICVV